MHYAVIDNNLQIVIRMIAGGANLNAVNGSGRSALILAARKQHYEIAQVLVESGADLEIVDREQKRASDYVREFPKWGFLMDKTTPLAANIEK